MKESILKASLIVGMIIAFPLISLIVQYLWNLCLVPAVDSINTIGYLQALGIYFLVSIFKGNLNLKSNENAK